MNIGIALLALGISNYLLIAGRILLRSYRNLKTKTFVNQKEILKRYQGGFNKTMSRREACLILGIKGTENLDVIKSRHRELMMANHPDNEGSTYLAAKINQAKQLIIKS